MITIGTNLMKKKSNYLFVVENVNLSYDSFNGHTEHLLQKVKLISFVVFFFLQREQMANFCSDLYILIFLF